MWMRKKTSQPETKTLLDIGCGNGSFLKTFRETYPNWQMIDAEMDVCNRSVVEAIPGAISCKQVLWKSIQIDFI
jgi:tRNA G46 methylase TrmB